MRRSTFSGQIQASKRPSSSPSSAARGPTTSAKRCAERASVERSRRGPSAVRWVAWKGSILDEASGRCSPLHRVLLGPRPARYNRSSMLRVEESHRGGSRAARFAFGPSRVCALALAALAPAQEPYAGRELVVMIEDRAIASFGPTEELARAFEREHPGLRVRVIDQGGAV